MRSSSRRPGGSRFGARLAAVSLRDLLVSIGPVVIVIAVAIGVGVKFLRPAPPGVIRLLGGPENSTYRTNAEKYKALIERFGVKVEILPSRGSLENLERLAAPPAHGQPRPDAAFVQSGMTEGKNVSGLVSLGSLFAQPLLIYYRGDTPVEILSHLRGKRLAIGPEGSGTRALALRLLKENDMDRAPTVLVDLGGEQAAHALIAGSIDAAFLMGDSAPPQVMRSLREAPGIALMNFRQAAGYARRLRFLSRLQVPEGALDLLHNFPPRPYELVGPTVELVAHKDLHPALSDLLIDAAREVHGTAGLFREAGEYPKPVERDFPISRDAERYYKAGGQFLYKHLPFWLASLIDRLMVIVVPLLVVIVPATRLAPALYRWRVRSRIYRWYGALMAIERDLLTMQTPEQRSQLHGRLDEIERTVEELKMPPAFADQLYVLREHIGLVRQRIDARTATRAPG